MGDITESDNDQDKTLANHEVRIVHLEKVQDKMNDSVEGLVKASVEQTKSIRILEKVMYGVLALALAAAVRLMFGIGV